ncbi:unnamed protein product, partial [Protopolystoma xenopodis]
NVNATTSIGVNINFEANVYANANFNINFKVNVNATTSIGVNFNFDANVYANANVNVNFRVNVDFEVNVHFKCDANVYASANRKVTSNGDADCGSDVGFGALARGSSGTDRRADRTTQHLVTTGMTTESVVRAVEQTISRDHPTTCPDDNWSKMAPTCVGPALGETDTGRPVSDVHVADSRLAAEEEEDLPDETGSGDTLSKAGPSCVAGSYATGSRNSLLLEAVKSDLSTWKHAQSTIAGDSNFDLSEVRRRPIREHIHFSSSPRDDALTQVGTSPSTHMHTYIHTYIHSYTYTYIHTYIHT